MMSETKPVQRITYNSNKYNRFENSVDEDEEGAGNLVTKKTASQPDDPINTSLRKE